MSNRMREALRMAQNGPLRRVHDQTHGQAPWPAHPLSLGALVRSGLLRVSERRSHNGNRVTEWFITDAGLEELKPKPPKVRQARPVFLTAKPQHVKADYTTDPSRALLSAGEVLDSPGWRWESEAAGRFSEARDRRGRAREIATRRKAA